MVGRVKDAKGQQKEGLRRERVRRKNIHVRKTVERSRNLRNLVVFPMLCDASCFRRVDKYRIAKAPGAESIIGRTAMKKLHAAVARRASGSQNAKITPVSELRCRKRARCCCTKQIAKSTSTKDSMSRAVFEVQMLTKRSSLQHQWK